MIAYTAFLLFLIGVFCCVKATVKLDKILSYLVLAAVLMTFALFLDGMYIGAEDVFSFVWNSSPSGDIKIDIISNAYNYEIVYPFFVATLITMLGNAVFRLEKNSGNFNAMTLFNLVAVILMITSTNFVQLLAALFITDILALFVIKSAQISRRYTMMNILADMLVFAMIAIINSRIKSLDIRQILRYNQIGFYPDFVAVCGLTAVFIRFGFLPFHIGICALKEIRLHGVLSILLLFSPLSALILLLKFHVVWQNSIYFLPYLNTVCIATLLWGLWRCLTVDSYKAKMIYGQMIFWPLLIELLRFNGFVWDNRFTALLLGMCVINESLYMFYYYCGRRQLMSQLSTVKKFQKTGIISSVLLILSAVTVLADVLYIIYNSSNRYYIWLFAVSYILALGSTVKQIGYALSKRTQEKFLIKFHPLMFLLLLGVLAYPLSHVNLSAMPVGGIIAAFSVCCLLFPLSLCRMFYKIEWLQSVDGFGFFYETLVNSARLLGRFLLLLVDRLFIEKFVVRVTASLAQVNIRFFRKVNNTSAALVLVLMMTTILLILSYKLGGSR